MSIELLPYEASHAKTWDAFSAESPNSTFLHTRAFISYHGDRFKDLSLLILDSGKLVGLFPAAQSLSDPDTVVSHPGITYGGLVHQGKLSGNRLVEVLRVISEHFAELGYRNLQYKPLPFIYSNMPAQDDLYALLQLGAQRTRCDLSCSIDFASRRRLSERRRRGLKKARMATTIVKDPDSLRDLWLVVEQNLARKHDASPVHSIEELTLLKERFPEQIQIFCALMNGVVEAGVILFNTSRVWHAQYIAASEVAYQISALDAVFDAMITEAQNAGARYFDFGTSNEDDGKVLNDGLYRYKSEFGGGGVVHEFYELALA